MYLFIRRLNILPVLLQHKFCHFHMEYCRKMCLFCVFLSSLILASEFLSVYFILTVPLLQFSEYFSLQVYSLNQEALSLLIFLTTSVYRFFKNLTSEYLWIPTELKTVSNVVYLSKGCCCSWHIAVAVIGKL